MTRFELYKPSAFLIRNIMDKSLQFSNFQFYVRKRFNSEA